MAEDSQFRFSQVGLKDFPDSELLERMGDE
jgi:hypothetical protein